MTFLLYHARAIGPICKRIAAASGGKIQAVCDRVCPDTLRGTVIRWDSRAEVAADHTINSAAQIRLSRNKSESRRKMDGLCPTTWFRLGDCEYPCLIRPRRHFAAHKFFVCNNMLEAKHAIRRCGVNWYASPIIQKDKEYRMFVFQGKPIKVVRRYCDNPAQIAWNIAAGGKTVRLKHESWPKNGVQKAVEAGKRLELGWYAADVIVDKQGQFFVLEINSAPGLQRDATITMLAKLFAKAGQ